MQALLLLSNMCKANKQRQHAVRLYHPYTTSPCVSCGYTGSVELSVVLCGDKYITELNQEWRNKAAPTDVLSFPATDWDDLIPGTPLALGDIVISLDTAGRQACDQGWAC